MHDLKQQGPCVLTIGQFDGVHLGHQRIFSGLRALAQKMGLPSAIWTFTNLSTKSPHSKLNHPLLQQRLLENEKIDQLFLMEFNADISNMEAAVFLQKVLLEKLQIRGIVLGQTARLGKDRTCTAVQFVKLAQAADLATEIVEMEALNGIQVSSSVIREHILNNRLEAAEQCLGRPYAMGGIVVQDQMKARGLGYPTANIIIDEYCHPPHGVYSCLALVDEKKIPAIAYIGSRPTMIEGGRTVLEVHIPHWSGNLYGHHLFVESLRWIRGEKHFASTTELCQQIAADLKIMAATHRQ